MKLITPKEAERAAWVDFEGGKQRSPTMLGIRIDQEYDIWIVERLFFTCAGRRRAKSRADNLKEVTEDLIKRCRNEERLMISWSRYDFDLLDSAVDEPYKTRLGELYRDGKFTAKRWNRLFGIGIASPHSLSKYMKELAWDPPEETAENTVGNNIRYLRPYLERGDEWPMFTECQKEKWRHVLKHNRHDLSGMESVVTKCSKRIQEHS